MQAGKFVPLAYNGAGRRCLKMKIDQEELRQCAQDLSTIFSSFILLPPRERVKRARELLAQADIFLAKLRNLQDQEKEENLYNLISKVEDQLDLFLDLHPHIREGEVA